MFATDGSAGRHSVALFFSRKIIEIINQAADHQRIFILCENVQNAAELVKSGLSIKSVNPGNLGVPSPISLEQTLRGHREAA
ncbi:hypothetical protein F8O53_09530, partial [Enterobacter sp. 63]